MAEKLKKKNKKTHQNRYEGVRSPYIYPMYGLGELPQAFARLAAVHGVSLEGFLFFLKKRRGNAREREGNENTTSFFNLFF